VGAAAEEEGEKGQSGSAEQDAAWGGKSVAALKKELKSKGLSQAGKKATLVARLVASCLASPANQMLDDVAAVDEAGSSGNSSSGSGGGSAGAGCGGDQTTCSSNGTDSALNDGMSTAAVKPSASSSPTSRLTPPLPTPSSFSSSSLSPYAMTAALVETELPPQPGSAILEVHQGYRQSFNFDRARILVDEDKTTVYNSNFVEVLFIAAFTDQYHDQLECR
jgi:hypothetical protein